MRSSILVPVTVVLSASASQPFGRKPAAKEHLLISGSKTH